MAVSRLVRAVVVAVVCVLAFVFANHDGDQDFEQVWFGASKMRAGADPYAAIGPGRERDQRWPLLYPGPALVIVTPFTFVPPKTARVMFSVLGATVLAVAMTRDGFARIPLFASYPFLSAVSLSQWTPWLAAGVLIPALGFFAAAKPNVGIAALAGASDRRALLLMLVGCCIVTAMSLVALPSWPASWTAATEQAPANVPLATLLPAGPFLLLALLRWRRPEARMLAALALVPQNPVPHGAVVMFAMRWRWWEACAITALSWAVVPLVYRTGVDVSTYRGFANAMGPATAALVFADGDRGAPAAELC